MSAHRQRELHYFLLLDREQQAQTIRRLAASGLSDYVLASTTGLSVEQIRRVLSEHSSLVEPATKEASV